MKTVLVAWMIPPQPPADLTVHLVVTDVTQNERAIASRALPYGAGSVPVWDAALVQLGFERTSEWRAADDDRSQVCEVKRA